MSAGTLYSSAANPRALKALIAAKYVGKTVDQPAFNFPADLQTDEMKELFPMAKMPVFKTPCGKPLFESNAIAFYLAAQDESVGLLGATAYEKGLVQTFMSFADNEIVGHLATLLYPIFGIRAYDKDAHNAAASGLRRSLNALEKWLTTRTYLASEQVTLADIVLFCTLLPLYKMYLDTITRAPFVNLNRWFNTILNQPNPTVPDMRVDVRPRAENLPPEVGVRQAAGPSRIPGSGSAHSPPPTRAKPHMHARQE
ncbi:hypothetical protein H696_05112 [Fonticula alba]|uniref:Glutathione S-transferase n=1 Tax=Fonticula alba TaxID=691883 RepID=A0A058Z2L6_FONAL|nr:hypothetical protein H696_05112 [Fonticula alba]KCV68183.1 hypothetical protein H696_05112 [Fonticula alba]|eukprot:XP_009497237.1 hypothetical protein H696_05112 [Fonticula alba]